ELFSHVRRPDGGPFFDRNGLLYLSNDELQSISQQLVAAQPVIGSLAQDPSLRGLFDALTLFLSGVERGDVGLDKLDPTLAVLAGAVDGVLAGHPKPLAWGELLTGVKPDPHELRRFILAKPALDYAALEPGAKATAEVRRLAAELHLTPDNGVRVRITRPVAAILATLAAGLVLTAGFAAAAIGSLNLISVAFGVLFIGLGVDFSIQFSIRYRDRRHRDGEHAAALRDAARSIGPSLALAAGATAIGFFAFVPTDYIGVRELGWIAGAGMTIAIALNFTLLPALLTLLRPRGEPEPVGFVRALPLDRALMRRRNAVRLAAVILAAGGIALLPQIDFDFDPLDLKNPHSESVATARDLMRDPTTSPYAAEILAPSLDAAKRLADRLGALPEVAQAVTAASYIPEDQETKLAAIGDLSLLLGPTLTPPATAPPPTPEAALAALAACRDALRRA